MYHDISNNNGKQEFLSHFYLDPYRGLGHDISPGYFITASSQGFSTVHLESKSVHAEH